MAGGMNAVYAITQFGILKGIFHQENYNSAIIYSTLKRFQTCMTLLWNKNKGHYVIMTLNSDRKC